jgi:hypothetical protein
MANKFARSNGNFDGPIWALTSSGVAGSTTTPTIGDNAIANTFTIQITGSVACDNVTNGTTYGGTAGGTFNLGNASQLTSVIRVGNTTANCINLSGSNSAVIIGDVITTEGNQGIAVQFTGSALNITGTIEAHTGNNTGTVKNAGTGNLTVTGIVYGNGGVNRGHGIQNTSTGQVTIIGPVIGRIFAAVDSSTAGTISVVGNVISDSRGGAGIASSNAAANVKISGNLIGAPNGIPAVYAASYTVNPVPYQTYIRYANNGTGVGSDAYLYHYTTDSLSAFSIPPVSAVRAGLQYANNTLTGTCEMPAASAVTFGALVDNTTGTAALTNNNLFDVSVTSLTATDSLGARLKNSATVESVGRIIASFSN